MFSSHGKTLMEFFHGFSMVFPWFFHGFSMVFPWFFHGNSHGFFRLFRLRGLSEFAIQVGMVTSLATQDSPSFLARSSTVEMIWSTWRSIVVTTQLMSILYYTYYKYNTYNNNNNNNNNHNNNNNNNNNCYCYCYYYYYYNYIYIYIL